MSERIFVGEHLEAAVTPATGGGRDQVTVRGHLEAWLNGEKIADTDNVVTNNGHVLLADRFHDNTTPAAPLSHVGIGTGTTAPAATDTQIQTLAHIKAYDSFTIQNSPNNNQIVASVQFAANEGSGDISEAGIFNGDTNGTSTMFARGAIAPARTKQASDTLDITWTFTF